MRLMIGCLLSAISAALTMALTSNSLIAILVLVAVGALNLAAWLTTVRGLLAAVALFFITPGVFGEMSAITSALGALILTAVILTYKRDVFTTRVGLEALAVLSLAAVASGMLVLRQPAQAGILMLLAIAAVLAGRRRAFMVGLARGLVIIFAVFLASYLITMLIGFSGHLITTFGGRRQMEVYLPITVATSGPPFIPGTRRGAPLIGEPGLVIFYLLPLVAAIFAVKERRQIIGLLALVAGVLITAQSLASILAAVSALLIGLALTRIRRKSFGSVVLVIFAIAITAPGLIANAFDAKLSVASVSFTDRGFAGADSGNNNINLLVAFTNTPMLAVAITAALIFALFVCVRSMPGAVLWIGFMGTAVAAQPSHWQLGAWFVLIAFGLGFAANRERANIERDARTGFIETFGPAINPEPYQVGQPGSGSRITEPPPRLRRP